MVTRALRNLPQGRNGNEDGPGPQRMTVLISRSPGSGAREKKTRDTASHAATRQAHVSQGVEGGHLP